MDSRLKNPDLFGGSYNKAVDALDKIGEPKAKAMELLVKVNDTLASINKEIATDGLDKQMEELLKLNDQITAQKDSMGQLRVEIVALKEDIENLPEAIAKRRETDMEGQKKEKEEEIKKKEKEKEMQKEKKERDRIEKEIRKIEEEKEEVEKEIQKIGGEIREIQLPRKKKEKELDMQFQKGKEKERIAEEIQKIEKEIKEIQLQKKEKAPEKVQERKEKEIQDERERIRVDIVVKQEKIGELEEGIKSLSEAKNKIPKRTQQLVIDKADAEYAKQTKEPGLITVYAQEKFLNKYISEVAKMKEEKDFRKFIKSKLSKIEKEAPDAYMSIMSRLKKDQLLAGDITSIVSTITNALAYLPNQKIKKQVREDVEEKRLSEKKAKKTKQEQKEESIAPTITSTATTTATPTATPTATAVTPPLSASTSSPPVQSSLASSTGKKAPPLWASIKKTPSNSPLSASDRPVLGRGKSAFKVSASLQEQTQGQTQESTLPEKGTSVPEQVQTQGTTLEKGTSVLEQEQTQGPALPEKGTSVPEESEEKSEESFLSPEEWAELDVKEVAKEALKQDQDKLAQKTTSSATAQPTVSSTIQQQPPVPAPTTTTTTTTATAPAQPLTTSTGKIAAALGKSTTPALSWTPVNKPASGLSASVGSSRSLAPAARSKPASTIPAPPIPENERERSGGDSEKENVEDIAEKALAQPANANGPATNIVKEQQFKLAQKPEANKPEAKPKAESEKKQMAIGRRGPGLGSSNPQ